MFEKGAGSPSNNLVLVSHWYFEEASKALVVDGCTMNAFATTWGGTINGIPVWRASCFSFVATAQSRRRVTRTVQRRNCNLSPTRCSSKRAAMLAFHGWASDMREGTPAGLSLGCHATLRKEKMWCVTSRCHPRRPRGSKWGDFFPPPLTAPGSPRMSRGPFA